MGLTQHQLGYTNIKICGLSQIEDIDAVIQLPIEAIGLVFYAPSSRNVSPEQAKKLCEHLNQSFSQKLGQPLQVVALVVDPSDDLIAAIKSHITVDIWQFHGEESAKRCAQIAQSTLWMKAARIDESFALSDFCLQYRDASAWIFDAVVDGYGGGGQTFNWKSISKSWIKENGHRVVLSGGLNARNVIEGIAYFAPLGVDVSSGVEVHKGKKDPQRMQEFVSAVRSTDQSNFK